MYGQRDDSVPANEQPPAELSDSTARIFEAKIAAAREQRIDLLPMGVRVAAVGKLFLGTPYVGGTLDLNPTKERLVLNLEGLDCVTFYENAWAIARVLGKHVSTSGSIVTRTPITLDDYEKELTLLRYRDGVNTGYHSRLHYSTDYFYENERKGLLTDVTKKVGGVYAQKNHAPIDFMTKHRTSYRALEASDSEFAKITSVERRIAARGPYDYIPKANIYKIERGIKTGDILGVVTDIAGLDCSHTGIAIEGSDGRIYFMHASSAQHKVIISDRPLADYLADNRHQIGVIITRPNEVTHP